MVWHPITEHCVEHDFRYGRPYEEISCVYPKAIGWSYFQFEYDFKPLWVWEWMEANPWFPIFVVAFYAVAIFLGRTYFETRPAWNLRGPLAAWNLGLAVFSAWGFMRVMPLVVHNFYYYGLRDNVCGSAYNLLGSGPSGMWVLVFVLSKFAELIDTFFIVVHKKPLMFLHWYHHITVLLGCWHSWISETPTGTTFCALNFGVHAVMYFYYFLMAIRYKPKWFNPMFITVIQIVQMVAGVFLSAKAYMYLKEEEAQGINECHANMQNIQFFFVVYASYLFLFCKFFAQRYIFKASAKKTQKKE